MSYIDSYKHEYLENNLIGGVVVYLAKEDIQGEDFKAKKGQFIIGGGGGENSAAVIEDINHSISLYLDFEHGIENDEIDSFRIDNSSEGVNFFYWSIKEYHDFYENALKEGFVEGFLNGNSGDYYRTIELWIHFQIAKIAIKEKSEMINPILMKYVSKIRD